jgi:hypothetical protein
MKPNRSLLFPTAWRAGLPAVMICVLSLVLAPRGWAQEKGKTEVVTSPWAIQVEPVQADPGQLPPEFGMAIYENLVADLTKTEKFQQVFRSGDRETQGVVNLLSLHMTLQNFERGNQTERAVTTVAGATKIKVLMKVTNRDGNVLLEKDVQGTVRIFGENLKASFALAKDISNVLLKASLPAPTKGAGQ